MFEFFHYFLYDAETFCFTMFVVIILVAGAIAVYTVDKRW